MAGLLPGLLPAHAEASERWPAWPTEVSRLAASLSTQDPGREAERERLDALEQLSIYPSELITEAVVLALADPSTAVQREALRLCYARQLAACVPGATQVWNLIHEPSLRMQALRVLALELDPSRLAIVLSVLRDPNPELRLHAAEVLGWAPLPDGERPGQPRAEVRAALLVKLADADSQVRRVALRTLGRLGPGPGTLTIARMLDDPEPAVRAAAAVALGQGRDPHAAPALLRAWQAPNEPEVRAAIIASLARLPSPLLPAALLSALDAPPAGLSAIQIAEAIGARSEPEPELIAGLVERLADEPLTRPALRALLLIGAPAAPAIHTALERGVEPALQDALLRLASALDSLPASAPPRPELEDLTIGTPLARFEAAAALSLAPSPAQDAALAERLLADGPIAPRRVFLAALAARGALPGMETPWLPWARLVGAASDRSRSLGDRCLALLAMGAVPPRWTDAAQTELAAFTGDPNPAIRGCAGFAGARLHADRLTGLFLLDEAPEVRATVLLGVAEASAGLRARLRILADDDPNSAVRQHAEAALRRRADERWILAIDPFDPTVRTVHHDGVRWAIVPESLMQ